VSALLLAALRRLQAERCIVPGCSNEVVRVLVHKANGSVRFGVCQFHGDTIIRYGTEEQVRDYVFPEVKA